MAEKTSVSVKSRWRFPSYFSYFAIAWLAFWILLVTAGGMDAFFSAGFLVIFPILFISIVLIVWSIDVATSEDRRQVLPILSSLAILVGIPMLLYFYEYRHPLGIHEAAKWLASSGKYKAEVQAEETSANGELKHILWDSLGPSFANTTVYLVFDSSDSLAAAAKIHQPGKFAGLPCKVFEVRRLENRWYAIVFYQGQDWDQCN
jgi:hypothetical protein